MMKDVYSRLASVLFKNKVEVPKDRLSDKTRKALMEVSFKRAYDKR